MFNLKQITLYCLLVLFTRNLYASEVLTLEKAEKIAYNTSYLAKKSILSSQSYEELSVAAGQYADPKLNFGLINLPNDNFSISSNATTQLRFGLKQKLPRGHILDFKTEEKQKQSRVELFKAQSILRYTVNQSRLSYVALFREIIILKILIENQNNFQQLVQITEQKFSNGLASQQDVINAKLQLSKFGDRVLKAESSVEQQRSHLSQWIDNAAWLDLSEEFPKLNLELNDTNWLNHPLLLEATELISTLETRLLIEQEMKKSSWTVGIEYRKRFGDNPDSTDRSDMLAMTASIDIPYFSKNKQDKMVSAAQYQIEAAEQNRLDIKRKLSSRYSTYYSQLNTNQDRLLLYKTEIIQSSQKNKQAALLAYQNGKNDFSALLTAEILVLETKINMIDLKIEVLRAKAKILYLTETQEDLERKLQETTENIK